MPAQPKKILIAGGGITGLSAAYYLQKLAQQGEKKLDIILVEKAEHLGGKIKTIEQDGFVIERGPDSFLSRKQPIIDLTKELGLIEELTGLNPDPKGRQTYIVHNKELQPMPPGLVLGIPTELTPLVTTKLISAAGKARAALDLTLPKRAETSDESLGHFIERRLGKEVLTNIVEPLLAGIYAGDTYALSLQATFPQFATMEQEYGSLIKGMAASRKQTTVNPQAPDVAKNSVFLTYKKGLRTLVDALTAKLSTIQILKNSGLTSIQKQQQGYEVSLDNGDSLRVDGLILTLPAYTTAELLAEHLQSSTALKNINYVSVANIVLAFNKADCGQVFTGSGFLVPNHEGYSITACTWTSTKWPHSAPSDQVLVRCYVGRAGDEAVVDETDQELEARVRQDLQDLIGLTAQPLFTKVTRWHQAMPQYPVGHLQHVDQVRQELASKLPGVLISGAAYEGVGLPDCIDQGRKAAEEIYQFI